VLSVGVPLLLLAAAGVGAWWAISGDKLGGDPIKAAEILEADNRPDLAAQVLHRALERGDTNPRVQEKLGEAYLAQKDFDSASYHFGQAALRNPDNAYVQAQQGRAYYLGGHMDQAEFAYRQALGIDPSYAPALSDLGRIHAKRQRYKEAAAFFERAVRFERSADVFYNLGLVRKADAQEQLAMNAFKDALREDPNHRASMVQLAELLANRGQLEQAAAQLLTASQIRHEDLDLHLKLATIYEKTGHKNLAIREWHVCLAQGRDNPVVAERARRALDKLGADPES
jgi:tetratricopeptide (TPR) repeat protein